MNLIDELKTVNANITWIEEDDINDEEIEEVEVEEIEESENKTDIIGKSPPIVRFPYKFEEELQIIENNKKTYLRFSCDDDNNFLIPISNKLNFIHLYNIYTKRYYVIDEDIDPDDNVIAPLPFRNIVYYYGGLCPNMEKLETKMFFNKFLCHTEKKYRTAYWLSEQQRKISTYHTMFSNSMISFKLLTKFSVQLETKNSSRKFHPLFIKINYPSTKHTNTKYETMGDNMLYDVLHNNMPYDVWAALQTENIFDRDKVIDMISGMDDDLYNEKDYLTFVLTALDELNTNPYVKNINTILDE
jgi:hypothetical protein